MSLKIFRCRCCGEKVEWSSTSCNVCNRLVSNDRAKRCIIISGAVIVFIIVASIMLLL